MDYGAFSGGSSGSDRNKSISRMTKEQLVAMTKVLASPREEKQEEPTSYEFKGIGGPVGERKEAGKPRKQIGAYQIRKDGTVLSALPGDHYTVIPQVQPAQPRYQLLPTVEAASPAGTSVRDPPGTAYRVETDADGVPVPPPRSSRTGANALTSHRVVSPSVVMSSARHEAAAQEGKLGTPMLGFPYNQIRAKMDLIHLSEESEWPIEAFDIPRAKTRSDPRDPDEEASRASAQSSPPPASGGEAQSTQGVGEDEEWNYQADPLTFYPVRPPTENPPPPPLPVFVPGQRTPYTPGQPSKRGPRGCPSLPMANIPVLVPEPIPEKDEVEDTGMVLDYGDDYAHPLDYPLIQVKSRVKNFDGEGLVNSRAQYYALMKQAEAEYKQMRVVKGDTKAKAEFKEKAFEISQMASGDVQHYVGLPPEYNHEAFVKTFDPFNQYNFSTLPVPELGENHPWNKNPRQMPYKKGVFGFGEKNDDDASSASSDSDNEEGSPKIKKAVGDKNLITLGSLKWSSAGGKHYKAPDVPADLVDEWMDEEEAKKAVEEYKASLKPDEVEAQPLPDQLRENEPPQDGGMLLKKGTPPAKRIDKKKVSSALLQVEGLGDFRKPKHYQVLDDAWNLQAASVHGWGEKGARGDKPPDPDPSVYLVKQGGVEDGPAFLVAPSPDEPFRTEPKEVYEWEAVGDKLPEKDWPEYEIGPTYDIGPSPADLPEWFEPEDVTFNIGPRETDRAPSPPRYDYTGLAGGPDAPPVFLSEEEKAEMDVVVADLQAPKINLHSALRDKKAVDQLRVADPESSDSEPEPIPAKETKLDRFYRERREEARALVKKRNRKTFKDPRKGHRVFA